MLLDSDEWPHGFNVLIPSKKVRKYYYEKNDILSGL